MKLLDLCTTFQSTAPIGRAERRPVEGERNSRLVLYQGPQPIDVPSKQTHELRRDKTRRESGKKERGEVPESETSRSREMQQSKASGCQMTPKALDPFSWGLLEAQTPLQHQQLIAELLAELFFSPLRTDGPRGMLQQSPYTLTCAAYYPTISSAASSQRSYSQPSRSHSPA